MGTVVQFPTREQRIASRVHEALQKTVEFTPEELTEIEPALIDLTVRFWPADDLSFTLRSGPYTDTQVKEITDALKGLYEQQAECRTNLLGEIYHLYVENYRLKKNL